MGWIGAPAGADPRSTCTDALPPTRLRARPPPRTRRLVSAVTDPSLRSGVFYASAANTITGPVIDQAETMPELGDPAVQNHAVEAIYRFIT